MPRKLILKPYDYEMTLEECPPGPFLYESNYLGFKSEYRNDSGSVEAYCESGEFYCGEGLVIPLEGEWIDT